MDTGLLCQLCHLHIREWSGHINLLQLTQLLGISRGLVQTDVISFSNNVKSIRHKAPAAEKHESLPEFVPSAFLFFSFNSNTKAPWGL